MRRGFTLTEVLITVIIGLVIFVAVMEIYTGGTTILGRAARTSAMQVELQGLMEVLTRDAEELLTVKGGATFDAEAGGSLVMVVQSKRYEPGLPPAKDEAYRRVEYKVKTGGKKGFAVERTVAVLNDVSKIDAASGGSPRTVARNILKLKVVPMAFVPVENEGFKIGPAKDMKEEASGPAFLIVEMALADQPGATEDEKAVPALATKLWCRNRAFMPARFGVP
jgi:prepilin-type N-terminal cleavage/methylation domain-containing protein